MGLIESWLARQVVDAVSPTARKERQEAERVAVAMGYGGLSERQRYLKARRDLAETKVQEAKWEADWADSILKTISSEPGAWTRSALVFEFFHFSEDEDCAQRRIIDRFISEGVILADDDGHLWPQTN